MSPARKRPPSCSRQRRAGRLIAAGQHQASSRRRERQGDGAADTRSRAGDQRSLCIQLCQLYLPYRPPLRGRWQSIRS